MLLRGGRGALLRCAATRRKGDANKDGPSEPATPSTARRKADEVSSSSSAPVVLELQSRGRNARPLTRSAFRRKPVSEEELKQRKEQARRELEAQQRRLEKQAAEGPEPALQPPMILIDGYNILNADPTLKHYMGVTDTLQFARAELEQRVQAYANASGARCTIVYDAMSRYDARLSPEEQNKSEELSEGLSIAFATTMEADSYIINTAQKLKKQGCSRVYIVSNDRRIHAESGELADEVIGSIDVGMFTQDLQDCSRGFTAAVATRFPSGSSPSSNALVATYEQLRADAAAKARKLQEQSRQLPRVDTPDVPHKLAQELGVGLEVLGEVATGKAQEEPLDTAALSADLNSLFGPSKPTRPRRRI